MDVRNTRVCPRTGRCKDAPRPRRRHSAVPGSSLSANSPWSRIFPVREPVAAWHCPRHFLSLTRLFHSLSASNSRSVRAIVCVAPTRSRAAIVLSLVRMITFDQPATAREAVPADCTARCAPSRSSSLRCGPPLTARAPPPAWPLRFHARAIHFWQLNRRTFKNMSSRKVRNFCKHSKRQMPVDIPGNVRLRRTPKFRFSPWYFRSRDSKNHHHVEASLGGGSREVNP
jgi:hypothetical protein